MNVGIFPPRRRKRQNVFLAMYIKLPLFEREQVTSKIGKKTMKVLWGRTV